MVASSVERTLGILLAKVEGIEKSMARADDQCAVVHRRMDDLVTEVGDVKIDVAQVMSDVADTKAVTEDVKRWKLMGMGALGVTGIAAGFVGSALTYYWAEIIRVIRGAG